jgi:hypothetical protein
VVTPRLSKIIWTDWPALASAIAIPMIWAIHFVFPLIRPGAKLLWLAVAISLTAGIGLTWRFARIHRLFARGNLASARVTGVQMVKDRGRLEFEYEVDGKLCNSWMPVHRNKDVLSIRIGQEVDILIDPERPNTAIVRHLYCDQTVLEGSAKRRPNTSLERTRER